jgi:hypothetical protein
MGQTFRRDDLPVIQLNNRTAFLSALLLSTFVVFIELIIITYSTYIIGDDLREIFFRKLSRSYYIEPVIMFLVNTFLLYIFFQVEFWIIKRSHNNRKKL